MHAAGFTPIERIARLTALASWMAFIFWLSSVSNPDIPSGFASPGHAALYAVLGFLVYGALDGRGEPLRIVALAIVVSSLYGVTDEIHQAFVPGRMPDPLDWSWDTLGAAVGALGGRMAWGLLARRRIESSTGRADTI